MKVRQELGAWKMRNGLSPADISALAWKRYSQMEPSLPWQGPAPGRGHHFSSASPCRASNILARETRLRVCATTSHTLSQVHHQDRVPQGQGPDALVRQVISWDTLGWHNRNNKRKIDKENRTTYIYIYKKMNLKKEIERTQHLLAQTKRTAAFPAVRGSAE